MREIVEHLTVREGFTVLLIAEHTQELPEGLPRIEDLTRRACSLRFRALAASEGEAARAEFLAGDDLARARFRTRRLRAEVTSVYTDGATLTVRCAITRNGETLALDEQIWNTDEETLLPPAQKRAVLRRKAACGRLRQKINNFSLKNRANRLANTEKM